MSKDQVIGGIIFIVCIVVMIGYISGMFLYPYLEPYILQLGINLEEAVVQKWLVAIPVLVAFVAVLGIGAWIGWTMATTPPPKPIEEIDVEVKEEEKRK